MLDRIANFLISAISIFQFWSVVDQYEQGIILRLGKYHRTIGGGIHFLIPLNVDVVYVENIVLETTNLNSQSLTTKDNQTAVLSAVIGWKIHDIKKYILDAESAESVLADSVYGLIAKNVQQVTWEEVNTQDFKKKIRQQVKNSVKKYGIEIVSFEFADISRARTLRLLNE